MKDPISLKVNGKLFEGWLSASLTRSMLALSGGFELGFTDKWMRMDRPLPIVPGDECVFAFSGEEVLSGYVDSFTPSMDANSRSLAVSGRDKAADLVDCSVEKYTTYRNVKLDRLATLIAEPFGVKVSVGEGVDLGATYPEFKIGPGEKAFDCIEKASRERAVLALSDSKGGLLLTRAATKRASSKIVLGENAEKVSAAYDHKERYSKYKVVSQTAYSEGTDAEIATGVSGIATDEGVKRYRPLVIVAETQGSASDAKKRAQWEAVVRAAKASTVTATLPDFRQADGRLWVINELTTVHAPWVGIFDQEMLVTGVKFSRAAEGSFATVDLMPPDAFKVLAAVGKNDLWQKLYDREARR